MTTEVKIRDENYKMILTEMLQKCLYYLSPVKIDKCEYLTGKEILPSDQSRMIKQDKLTYSCFRKALHYRCCIMFRMTIDVYFFQL